VVLRRVWRFLEFVDDLVTASPAAVRLPTGRIADDALHPGWIAGPALRDLVGDLRL
jgi:hypothetical protein